MTKKREAVFISSTSTDLKEYRTAVEKAVKEMGYYPIMMEFFPAMDVDPVKGCMDEVDKADIYIGIFAHRYGYCPEGSEISITEMEFNRATERGIRRLCFLADGNVPRPIEDDETEETKEKLKDFKRRIEKERIRKLFSSPDDLARLVTQALYNLQKPPAIDWKAVRDICKQASESAVASLDKKFDPELFVRRETLEWHVNRFLDSSQAHYMLLTGKSGMGKTAFLCDLEKRMRGNEAIACLLFDCGNLSAGSEETVLQAIFGGFLSGIWPDSSDMEIPFLLNLVEQAEGFDEQKKLLIIVDAMNEHESMDRIVRALASLQKDKKRPWLKVIMSCRPHVRRLISENFLLSVSRGGYGIEPNDFYRPPHIDQWFVELPCFSQEEAERAYEKYRQVYEFRPEKLHDLKPSVRKRLQEPLLLWLLAEIYRNGEISSAVAGLDINIIPTYTEQILSHIKELDRTLYREYKKFLEIEIPRLMVVDNFCRNRITLDDIPKKYKFQLELFLQNGVLDQIVDESKHYIRFRFERFYDYYFGLRVRELTNEFTILDCERVKETQVTF